MCLRGLCPGGRKSAIIKARFGIREIAPVETTHCHRIGERGGHAHQQVPIATSGFNQQDPDLRIRRQAVSEDAACRSGANNDVVKFGHCSGNPSGQSCNRGRRILSACFSVIQIRTNCLKSSPVFNDQARYHQIETNDNEANPFDLERGESV